MDRSYLTLTRSYFFQKVAGVTAAYFRPATLMLALLVLCGVISCRWNSGEPGNSGIADELWANGQLRFIICSSHLAPNGNGGSGYGEESTSVDRWNWSLIAYQFQSKSGHRITKDKF